MAKKTKMKISPQGMQKIAKHFGYKGDMAKFREYLSSDPAKQHLMNRYYDKARKLYAQAGGVVGYQTGGVTQEQQQAIDKLAAYGATTKGSGGDYSNPESFKNYQFNDPNFQYEDLVKTIEQAGAGKENKIASDLNVKHGAGAGAFKFDDSISTQPVVKPGEDGKGTPVEQVNPIEKDMQDMAKNPTLTGEQKVTPTKIDVKDDQFIGKGTGQLTGDDPQATFKKADAEDDVVAPTAKKAETVDPTKSKDDVKDVTDKLDAEELDKDKINKIDAEQQTESSVSDLEAEQGKGILMDDPKKRTLEEGELVEAVADAEKAAQFTEEIKAAQGDPSEKSTMRYQMAQYMNDFKDGNVPAWAAGAMRSVVNQMAAQGISGSNATQAAMQAMLEKSIDLASIDAGTFAKFDAMNLSNRQQRAMLAAEQRAKFMGQEFDQKFQSKVINASKISDIANMNFTAEQQVALENSRIANTMNLQNLNNKQALVMAEAAALANLDIANLNNRQQAAVQNAQNFLAVDMANLNNRQQTSMFKAQASINSILSDQAATNAAKQFNASSENQMTQFYDNLSTQVKQFNTSQANAMSQFNAGQENAINQFNTQIQNQRDQFNAQNQMVIAQSNVQWRRAVATQDTAAINRANELNAQALIGMSQMAYQQIWQQYGDAMERAWKSGESELDRLTSLAQTKMELEGRADMAKAERDANNVGMIGGFLMDFLF
tara:strand:- start:5395 stop:7539 length:2145 start_codon:yes stop_codon:yes gene_type:complete